MRYVAVLLLLVVVPLYASESRFQRIRFTGLKNVAKHDIIRMANIYSKDGIIFVDKEKLENALEANALIKSHKLIDNRGVLTIVVQESVPEMAVYVVGNESSRFCEIDDSFRIVTVGEIRSGTMPLITIPVESFNGRQVNQKTRVRIERVLEKAKSYAVWSQIDNIDFSAADYLLVTLKARDTVFTVFGDGAGFKKLNACVGYLDAVKHYPFSVDLREKIFVFE
ncbi:MAG: FtsQ-type POTRA domain-containing protein [Spirochaetes bacterium]|jgi:hypothetical protein|nr:FtsQ-type POTRA domain-containing protein [Spirochaetota bacterium]